ncbi:MAG: membrane protein insertase YidC, partial [Mycoplasmataceae bacterium]|nr:membrane protein insertase YidC [Mycoplasmataceae bacterium]
YDVANELLEIPIFIQKKPTIKPTDPIKLKEWENAKLGGKFQAYRDGETSPVKINDKGQYLKEDGTTVYDVSNQDDVDLIEQFKYTFEFEKLVLKIDLSNSFASEKFSRDYLQSLVNVVMQFDQLGDIDKIEIPEIPINLENQNSITEKRLNTLNSIKSGTYIEPAQTLNNQLSNSSIKAENALYSNDMRKAILNYQSNIVVLLSGSGYSIPKLNFSDDPDSWENSNYTLEFQPTNKSSYNFLYNGSTIGQKPIVTWGDAWGLGPFYGFVVYPISCIVNGLVGSLPSSLGGGVALLSIVISVIAARMLTLLLTYKSVFAQAKQQGLAPKKAKIDAKYAAYKGNKQMEQKKRQETSELYKNNNINMLTPLLSTLVSMPIFLSMWRIIQGIPFIKSTSLWGINFSQTSWRELLSGEWQYLILIILAVVVQAGSQFLPRYLNKKRMNERSNVAEKEAMKKANKTQNIIMIIFVGMAIIFEAGVQIYWIVGGIWMMIQTLLIHHIQKTKFFKEKLIKYV